MNMFPYPWCLGAQTGWALTEGWREVGELSWYDFSSGSLTAGSSWPLWPQVSVNIVHPWAFCLWDGKSIINLGTAIFFRVSWYSIHICINSVFQRLSSKYPNLSVPSVACWDPDWDITLYNLQSPMFPKHARWWLPSLYFSLLSREADELVGTSWNCILFFLSTNSGACEPSFHRILELPKDWATVCYSKK